ncbi:bifunctional riboflavin kinase/FAD synthetase [Mangrovicella endophytica]|uniref:bifunctional riboflavin kinase/FAD synthetase n=1 Tax=Mangrovicella endophytica TaxID=2066697 RepID=UPI000C9E5506|nr:bifunctional riboflavin kinase/FAD synthetase [Mangrovicella endophytica]
MAGQIRRLPGTGDWPADLSGAVVAIGNFDGVHRGHQEVLEEARRIAEQLAAPLVCLTFEPHPRTFFAPERPVPRLTLAPMKARLLGALGFDAVIEQRFDRDFSAMSAEAFIDTILVTSIKARHVVVGFDFQFGAGRRGTPAFLKEGNWPFGVTLVEAFGDEGGTIVSSSRIRDALHEGNLAEANALLGYRWTIAGPISDGQKLGRTLGFPTANLVLPDDHLLKLGIYAVRLRRADGTLHEGVASYGRRPTFDNGAALFETYLFDFSGDLYGETVEVSLFAYQREEWRFESVDALVVQMHKDADEARALLAGVTPLSPLDARIAF